MQSRDIIDNGRIIDRMDAHGDYARWSGPWASKAEAEAIVRDAVAPKVGGEFQVRNMLSRWLWAQDVTTGAWRWDQVAADEAPVRVDLDQAVAA